METNAWAEENATTPTPEDLVMTRSPDVLPFYACLLQAYALLSEDERAQLDKWETWRSHQRECWGTSDWPGWRTKILGWEAWQQHQRVLGSLPARKKQRIDVDLRWRVWERDNFTCKRCGTRRNLSIDHVHPESLGGKTTFSNLQTLCKPCNSSKGVSVAE